MNTHPASTGDTSGSWLVAAVATAVLAVVLGQRRWLGYAAV